MAKKAPKNNTSSKVAKSSKAEDKKPSIGKRIKNWLHEYKVEMKKVRWMKPSLVFKNFGIVIASIVVVGAFVFGLDTGLINLFRLFMHIG